MSALFVHYDDTSVDQDAFTTSFMTLDDRGPDGRDCVVDRNIAIGCQHFVTDPTSDECTQPITDGTYVFAFDGRVDNSAQLQRDYSGIDDDMTDVEIFITLFKHYTVDAFEKIVGPFFAVAYNTATHRLICGRDTMGLRHIFYCTTNNGVLVASSPDAICAHPHVHTTPDSTAIASYLSRNSQYAELSFYENIQIVDRGSYLVCKRGAVDERRYHTFASQSAYSRPRPDAFRQVLNHAVQARTTGTTSPAISLSGGRDSNTIAALLVNQFDITPHAYSHVSRNPAGDERIQTEMRNMDIARDAFDLTTTEISIDAYDFNYDRCLSDYSFGLPILDPYLHMQVQLYREVSTDRTILLDGFGGNCFDGAGFHYHDLLTQGDISHLLTRSYGDTGATSANLISAVLPLVARLTAGIGTSPEPSWVTCDPPSSDIAMEVASLEKRNMLRFLLQYSKSLMRFQARQAALKHGVDLRFPLMDERLHREVLKMPPGSLRTGGRLKGLFLDAVDGLLPPEIEAFDIGMSFNPFLEQGLENYGWDHIERLLRQLQTSSLGIVDEETALAALSTYTNGTDQSGMKSIHLWRLLTIENWLKEQDYHHDRTSTHNEYSLPMGGTLFGCKRTATHGVASRTASLLVLLQATVIAAIGVSTMPIAAMNAGATTPMPQSVHNASR